jgi:hypothetical protein
MALAPFTTPHFGQNRNRSMVLDRQSGKQVANYSAIYGRAMVDSWVAK